MLINSRTELLVAGARALLFFFYLCNWPSQDKGEDPWPEI